MLKKLTEPENADVCKLKERRYLEANGRIEGDGHSNIRINPDVLEAAVTAIRGSPPWRKARALRGEADGERNRRCGSRGQNRHALRHVGRIRGVGFAKGAANAGDDVAATRHLRR